jgi:thiol:disulfide interchange protein DsbC
MPRLLPITVSCIAALSVAAGVFLAHDVRAQATTVAAKLEAPVDAKSGDKAAAVKTDLVKKFPELRDSQVRRIELGGLYEIVINGSEVFYTDEKVSHVILGGILDANTRQNITDERVKQLTAVKWEELPLSDAIKIVRGNGSRKVAVFADPFCGYCKRFEADLATIKDVTVYTFLLPIIRAESRPLSEKVWCSTDRADAWLGFMLRNQNPAGDGKCATPIDKTLAFSAKHKITGTPTMIFENGERAPGALPAAQIEALLAKASPGKSPSEPATNPSVPAAPAAPSKS